MALEIIADFASPGRGPAGLAWDGQSLWHADYREGRIYRLSSAIEVVDSLWCPGMLSGLTWDGRHLWQALLDEGTVRSIDPVSTDFDQTLDLTSHGLLSGAAWDGTGLRIVAQQSGDILTIDTESGKVKGRIAGPVAIGDIDFADGSIWLSTATPMAYSAEYGFSWLGETQQYTLIQIDAQDGREISRHNVDGLYTGLAWDAEETLWLASAAEQRIFRARITAD